MKFGSAFSDAVIKEQRKEHIFQTETSSWWTGYGRVMVFIICGTFAVFFLVWRLVDLTVIHGHMYRELADSNRTKELIRHAPRGVLLDRTGKPLVANIPQYRLLKPCEGKTDGTECVSYISEAEGNALQTSGLPKGDFLEVDYERHYLYPDVMSHVLGYVNELSPTELSDEYYTLRGYQTGDKIGRVGAEEVFEDRLRGRNGKELVEVDASGKISRVLGVDPEIAGENIQLSIDANLSQIVTDAFPKEYKGAVVVSKPSTGEILAMYSNPTFSSSAFSLGMTQDAYTNLINNPDQPMFNRAIGGVYPPGSTFKIVTSMAGLEENAITGDTTVEDTGVIKIGAFSFPNWFFIQYGRTDGIVTVVKALQRSNDIFFYKVGEWLGITKLSVWAKKVGIGKPLGIELPGEASGLAPDPAWKNTQFQTPLDLEQHNNEWYLGDTYHAAIGQGYVLTTPLQVNAWTNIIANGGKLCKPTILKCQPGTNCQKNCTDLKLKSETLSLITTGMRAACDTGGTGWPFFNFSVKKSSIAGGDTTASSSGAMVRVPVACKTGTAEFGGVDASTTHAWFTIFAPLPADKTGVSSSSPTDTSQTTISGDPDISVTVLLEGAGEGSDKAAPIAKKILEEWFSR